MEDNPFEARSVSDFRGGSGFVGSQDLIVSRDTLTCILVWPSYVVFSAVGLAMWYRFANGADTSAGFPLVVIGLSIVGVPIVLIDLFVFWYPLRYFIRSPVWVRFFCGIFLHSIVIIGFWAWLFVRISGSIFVSMKGKGVSIEPFIVVNCFFIFGCIFVFGAWSFYETIEGKFKWGRRLTCEYQDKGPV